MQLFNKIKSQTFIIFLLIGIVTVSCKSYYTALTIENAQSAKEELSPDIQSITLMNRSMSNQFRNHQEDSLQAYFYRKGFQVSVVVLDSTAADTTIRALSHLMFESGRYDVVVPVERNIERNLPYGIFPDTLSNEYVSKVCSEYQTDALMVLENFTTRVMTDYSQERNADGGKYLYASVDLTYDAGFRIYKPGVKKVTKEITVSDTIYWESADYSQERLFGKLPSIKQALISAGIKVALDVDSKISPSWTPEKRGYFLFRRQGDRGQQLMNENNYEEAAKYWAEMTQSTNKKTRSKAEFNLALVSELNGDIDEAIEWGLKSFYSQYRYQTEAYLKKLKARQETLQNSK